MQRLATSIVQLWVSHFRSTKFRCMAKQSYCFCFILHNSHSSVSNASHRPQTNGSWFRWKQLSPVWWLLPKIRRSAYWILLTGKMSRTNTESRCMRGVWDWLSFGPLISIWPKLLKAYNGSRSNRAYSDRMDWMIEVTSTLLGQLHFSGLLSSSKLFFRCCALPEFNACASPWCAAHFV